MFPNHDRTSAPPANASVVAAVAAATDIDAAALVRIGNQQLYRTALELLAKVGLDLRQAAQITLANWRLDSVPALGGDPLAAALSYHVYNLNIHQAFVQNLVNSLTHTASPPGLSPGLERITIR